MRFVIHAHLVNRPGNLVTPSVMAEEAEALALEYDMEFEILDVTMMEAMGMHALLAVGRALSILRVWLQSNIMEQVLRLILLMSVRVLLLTAEVFRSSPVTIWVR